MLLVTDREATAVGAALPRRAAGSAAGSLAGRTTATPVLANSGCLTNLADSSAGAAVGVIGAGMTGGRMPAHRRRSAATAGAAGRRAELNAALPNTDLERWVTGDTGLPFGAAGVDGGTRQALHAGAAAPGTTGGVTLADPVHAALAG
jgi:hypothetical protein